MHEEFLEVKFHAALYYVFKSFILRSGGIFKQSVYSFVFETVISYHYVGSMWDEYSIRSEIYVNGPVTATFYVYPDFIFYKKGI